MRNSRRGPSARRATAHARRTDEARLAEIAADAGVPVEDVLREVADFRLALETDLLIAAAAIDADAPEVMSDVLDGERQELRDFHDRLLDRLADAAVTELAADRERELQRRRLAVRGSRRVTRLVATAATLVGLMGSAAAVRTFTGPAEPVAEAHSLRIADKQMDDLSRAALGAQPEAAVAAATELHETLQTLIDEHGDDPQVAQQIVSLLTQDLALIKSQPELRSVLHEALSLARRLQRQAPPQVRATVAPLIKAATSPAPEASPKPKASPSPSPSPTPSPTPSEQPSSESSKSSNQQGSSNKSGEDDDPLPGSPI